MENIAPQAPPPLPSGVWYSSFPIIAAFLKVCAGCLEVLSWPASRSVQVALRSDRELPRGPCGLPRGLMCRSPRGPREQNLRPKFSNFGGFLALPTEMSFTTPHYYPKYGVWAIEHFLW